MTCKQILLQDEYKIFDNLKNLQKKSHKSGPLGWVRIFEQYKNSNVKKLLFEGSNMIVAQGRYFVAQKIFGIYDKDNNVDYRDYLVSHFSIGAGGATVDGDSVTLLGPHVCDTHLYKPIGLAGSHNEPGLYDNTMLTPELRNLYTSTGAVKPINSITLVDEDFEESSTNCTYKTKVKCECIVGPGDPPGLLINGYVPISEAGLYFVYGTDANMFAHVCFPPKYKEVESTITIDWYILC